MLELIGFVAGALTIIAYFPQAIKTIKTRKTRDLSLPTFVALTSSAVLWTIYGIGEAKPAIYITNGVVATLSLVILVIKIKEN